jgi:hypothetical protein
MLITGDSNWCTNMLMRWGQGNETFFMSAVHWLLGQEKRITIEPRKTDSASFFLSPAQRGVCHVTLAGIFVGLFLAAALVAWVRRR